MRVLFNWGMQDILVAAYKIFFVETFVLSWVELKHSKQTLLCILTSGITQALHFASRDCNFLTYKDLQLGTPRFPTSRLFALILQFLILLWPPRPEASILCILPWEGPTPEVYFLVWLKKHYPQKWVCRPEGTMLLKIDFSAPSCTLCGEDSWAHIHYTLASHSIEFAKNWVLSTSHSLTQEQKLNKNKNKNVRLFSLHVGAKTLEH